MILPGTQRKIAVAVQDGTVRASKKTHTKPKKEKIHRRGQNEMFTAISSRSLPPVSTVTAPSPSPPSSAPFSPFLGGGGVRTGTVSYAVYDPDTVHAFSL